MRKLAWAFVWGALIFWDQAAQAQSGLLDVNFIDPATLSGIVPQNLANQAIKMFGIYTAHRPYSGATSIARSNAFDLMVEASLVKIGPGVLDALRENGFTVSQSSPPAVPMAKLSIRKALGERVDLGVSGLTYQGQFIIGGDLKVVLHDAEEGPSFALRLGYTHAKVPYAYVKDCTVISPELVMSQALYFAEPYLGIGGRYIYGTLSVPFTVSNGTSSDYTIEKSGSGKTAYAFTGVLFRLGAQGLRLGIEGSFDVSGYHTLGGVFGLGF